MNNETSKIAIGSDAAVQVLGLHDHNDEVLNSAVVQLTALVDRITGATVTGVTLPLSLQYVADSDGNYEGQIPYNASFEVDRVYLATVVATSGGIRKQWTETIRVQRGIS